jgi:DNA-binding NtrC family response regulator
VQETNLINPASSRAAILAVSANEGDLLRLRWLFTGSNWELHVVHTLAEARTWLRWNTTPIAITDACLPDGDWRDFLWMVEEFENPPNLVVFSRQADDELWREALNLGVFDVLASDARKTDLFTTLSIAWRNWEDRRRHLKEGERACAC